MPFATNENLQDYVPDIFDHGVDDWSDELTKAEADVVNQIKIRYWNRHHDRSQFDKTKLTESQWTATTVYRALSTHIMPKLSTFRIDDVFKDQITFYKEKYEEELNTQFSVGIEYDTDGSGTVEDSEITEYNMQDRLYR
jgi:hypothetical protein